MASTTSAVGLPGPAALLGQLKARWGWFLALGILFVIIGFIGLGLGVAGGVLGAYVTNLCSLPVMGYTVDFALHPMLLVICFGTGMAVIIAAAWIPAERAARLNLLIALQYE